MSQNISLLPGYRLNEYQLVIIPHEELRNRVQQLRKEFCDNYNPAHSFYERPHLVLAKFTQIEMVEERMLGRLGQIAMGFPAFKVELRNFGSLPSHTIFIEVTTKSPIHQLIIELRNAQRLMKPDKDHKPHFFDDPQIVLARKLLPWQYEKSWLEYSRRHFTARFIADGMLMLKREKGKNAYTIVKRFEFQNLPVNIKQGDLFSKPD